MFHNYYLTRGLNNGNLIIRIKPIEPNFNFAKNIRVQIRHINGADS